MVVVEYNRIVGAAVMFGMVEYNKIVVIVEYLEGEIFLHRPYPLQIF